MKSKLERTGERIASLRRERGWTQQKLAAKCGLAMSTVAQIEQGHHAASAGTLEVMAKVLQVDVGEFE